VPRNRRRTADAPAAGVRGGRGLAHVPMIDGVILASMLMTWPGVLPQDFELRLRRALNLQALRGVLRPSGVYNVAM